MIYRILTASSLYDGHDAAINVFRRLFQKAGLEVIHIGHNRSVEELVKTAIEEDVNAVCVSSYQGGHMEYFRYLRQRLNEEGGEEIAIFGGGGGTILPSEIKQLESEGITRLYHPEDGQKLGLRGIIKDAISRMKPKKREADTLAKALTRIELGESVSVPKKDVQAVVIGLTGPGGAGKSSLMDELILRYLYSTPSGRVGVLAFDPTKRKTGGALLGDRIRMNSIYNERVFLRSMATRGSGTEMSSVAKNALELMKRSGFDLIILETTGIGQGDAEIVDLADFCLYVMTSEYGASTQLEKIDMLDYADVIVLNKFDRMGSEGAFEDVLHAYADSRGVRVTEKNRDKLPVFGTIASDFNNPGVTRLFIRLMQILKEKGLLTSTGNQELDLEKTRELNNSYTFAIIPSEKTFYLGKIASALRNYHRETKQKGEIASEIYKLRTTGRDAEKLEKELGADNQELLEQYRQLQTKYREEELGYEVRGKTIKRPLFSKSLSGLFISRIALPKYRDWGDILNFMRKENLPGHFPYTAGVFPLKNVEEEPKRQFAGEGAPERTNKRFHYLTRNDQAHRLSTAFDSVTLYGEDPRNRPDVYGKIGNSGVSIATLDDMKALYRGFDLIDPLTSVSLTINGPAPMILAMFLNTAIDFEMEKQQGQEPYEKVKERVLQAVRGTVQADILKEEQAQNTCIFSSKFALKMMGDIQEYFIDHNVRNFYSVSISGYHIAEAGANPISQLAFTLANGFTLVEYYLSRGMKIDDFAPNLSFFFSMGMDPEYSVIGRVARRIWAIAMRERYGGNERSCKLKYHIQTSGRSLHAQEIAFNDIRTTLQALYAVNDNCNSLHTNAYDEAITTPTEESVRRAMAIQMILNREYGTTKCENAIQGSYFIEELTDLVEEAVMEEFDSLSRRGGVLGAMEKQYQRHRIQSESMKYELMKESGELPIIGVNTFTSEAGQPDYEHMEVIRATEEEKQSQIERTQKFIERAGDRNAEALERLRHTALSGENIFAELMETVKYCSLGQITRLLYECGGQYRRSI
ncbi:Methylmalonyl-CoA mutase, mitochondrial [Waddlia chondrophila 2032/99]|uniref:Fused isobutyryl-CoA mutase n=1 Tax=Waddlia chondrophila 2032/99 TaxID=765953 RepID=F8LET0_9BACT|nr:Methylmalonyl-CoA mutase, mitochondrial [Waddlia chondrophila 2032/99]